MRLKLVVLFSHVDCPGKLLPLGFVINLLNGNAPFLAPGEERRVNNQLTTKDGRAHPLAHVPYSDAVGT